MKVEVDQSGKIGDTKVPTVLAFSNGKRYAILIPATVKRECVRILRDGRKLETKLYIQLFAVGLFLLLKHDFNKLDRIAIDLEYPGHEAKIKEHLINILRRSGVTVQASKVHFERVGKKSMAHHLALATLNSKVQPNKIIRLDEIMAEFRK